MGYSKRSRIRISSRMAVASRHVAIVRKSNQHICVIVVAPDNKIVTQASTQKLVKDGKLKIGSNIEAAKALATDLAQKLLSAGITHMAYNRQGWPYHGRIKALADQLRAEGLTI